jgi:hypothetical protein
MKISLVVAALLLSASAATAQTREGYHGNSSGHWSGDGGDRCYVPSTYMNYDDAVALGKQQLADQQKSLGEVAREVRAQKARSQENQDKPTK